MNVFARSTRRQVAAENGQVGRSTQTNGDTSWLAEVEVPSTVVILQRRPFSLVDAVAGRNRS
jgi:hypothetical protein